ncbi:MAG: DnaA regulatory inactivator Hda, partial [Burkholderiales bacterium]|nr:DnaA regulatory inactivator Hda [Burkholderiales bacterium]
MQQLILELAPHPAPTLENFVAGANAAALGAVREAIARRERAVYLWGEAGSGKSHLLHGFVDAARRAGLAAAYAAPPRMEALEASEALAADDVQRLDAAGEAALFECFNALLARRGALLAAGDRPAAELPLREDLRTRIASGIALQLRPLAEADKRAALLARAREL